MKPPPNLPLIGDGQTPIFKFNSPPVREGKGEGFIFNWSTYETPFPKVEKIIPANKLPENISEIPDDILSWAIECEITKKPFRIITQELEFYRKYNLPIPRRHPDQRHLDRMKLRSPRKLFERKCDKCGKNMQTTYAPERPEIVYCEDCYEKEIY
jgi:CxxC-x17-CxxC domain-containing protein